MFRKSSLVTRISLAFLFSMLSSTVGTYAGTSGNILHFPEKMNFSVSSNLDFVFGKDMLEDEDIVSNEMEAFRMYVQGSFAPLEYICLDVRLGAADYEFQLSSGRADDPGQDYGLGFHYGLGVRGKVVKIPVLDTWVGVGGQFNHYAPSDTKRYGRTFESDAIEWDFSADLSRNFPEWGPFWEDVTAYLGVRYSDFNVDYWHGPYIIKHGGFRNEDDFGIYLGTQYAHKGGIQGHIELQLLDQTALNIGAGYGF